MSPSKEWSVMTMVHQYPNTTSRAVPSKTGFAERFRILDPFQKYHGVRLADSAWHLGMSLDSRSC